MIPMLKKNQLVNIGGIICRVTVIRAENEGYLDGRRYVVDFKPVRPSQYGKHQHAHDLLQAGKITPDEFVKATRKPYLWEEHWKHK